MTNISYWKILIRKKVLPNEDIQNSKLGRCLGTLDLAALGIGATLGVGVYVLAGHVSRDQAGPSVILSFLIAAAASFLAGLCYAEFGARVPKSGSAYIYSYVCIGEFIAFVIGWNLLLEYIIGSASVSKGLSLYLDTLINDTFKNTFTEIAPMHSSFLAEYFDFFALILPLLLGVAMAFGLRKSAIINNVFTLLNIGIVLFVIIAGAFKADIKNWNIDPKTVGAEYNVGAGGFFPFGFSGTLKGAATCFFGYVGFDCIATTGEEVKNPKRAIPLAILLSLFTIFMAYFGVSTVLTLMWPYYLQDVNAPLPHVFNEIGWITAKWFVAIGGIFGLIASLFGAMFPLPRIIYAIAQDGLIFKVLGEVHAKYKTPVIGTLCAACLTGIFAALFDLKALVNMLSIGTLLAYTVVAISILILRFSNNLDDSQPPAYDVANRITATENQSFTGDKLRLTTKTFITQFFNINRITRPDSHSMAVAAILVTMYVISALGLALTIFHAQAAIANMEAWALSLTGVFTFFCIILLVALAVQPRERTPDAFTVPLVPLLPGISIFVNIFLMLMLDVYTWIRFGVWMAIGLPMYFACVCCTTSGRRKTKDYVMQIRETIKLNGTLNKAYEKEYDAFVKEQQEIEKEAENQIIKRNIEYSVANEVEEILKQAVLMAGIEAPMVVQEKNDLQRQSFTNITDTSIKSLSPTNSYDEIVPESEVIDQLTEKKTGNGICYFIGEPKVSESDPNPVDTSETDKECDNAIAMLDNILHDEEEYSRKYSDASVQSRPKKPGLATAIVHQESQIDVLDDDDDDDDVSEFTKTTIKNNDEPSEEPIISPPKSNDLAEPPLKIEDAKNTSLVSKEPDKFLAGSNELEESPPQPTKAVFAKLRGNDQNDFINKLNTLFKQKSMPTKAITARIGEDDISFEKQPPKRPALMHANSEHSNINSGSSSFQDLTVVGIQRPSEIPITQNGIPQAPKFDPILYKSLGRSRGILTLNAANVESQKPVQFSIHDSKPKPEAKSDNANHDSEPSEEPNVRPLSIKEKLEAIFKQNLINKSNSPTQTLSPTIPNENIENNIDTNSEIERTSSFLNKTKKFDTIEKQKLKFANVLREIDIGSPSLLNRAKSPDRYSLTEVFKFDNNNNNNNNQVNISPESSTLTASVV